MSQRSAGFTLIELMIAVAVAGILAAIAYNSYAGYVTRSNRALARTMLASLAAKQESQSLQNGAYATTLPPLIGTISGVTTSFYLNGSNAVQASSDNSTIYQVSISGASATAYTLQAVAQGAQAARDTACTTLTLTSAGQRTAANSGGSAADTATCWEK